MSDIMGVDIAEFRVYHSLHVRYVLLIYIYPVDLNVFLDFPSGCADFPEVVCLWFHFATESSVCA